MIAGILPSRIQGAPSDGTLAVREYLHGNRPPDYQEAGFAEASIETHGPDGRFGAVLFIEKEGFLPLFDI
jgi:hypothetical protein